MDRFLIDTVQSNPLCQKKDGDDMPIEFYLNYDFSH